MVMLNVCVCVRSPRWTANSGKSSRLYLIGQYLSGRR